MKEVRLTVLVSVVVLGLVASGVTWAEPMGTAFTYQGRLTDYDGKPFQGSYDFKFMLYDGGDGGSQIGDTFQVDDQEVTKGLFTVVLDPNGDFGPDAFNGEARWLEVHVREHDVGGFSQLLPRQRVTPTPYAIHAETAAIADYAETAGGPAGGDLTGTYPNPSIANDAVTSVKIADGDVAAADLANDAASLNQVSGGAMSGVSGNIGIGTPSPQSTLDVAGEITGDGLMIDGPVGGAGFDGWDTDASDDLTTSDSFSGDVTGPYNATVVGDDSHSHSDGTVSDDISINNSRLYAPSGVGNVGIGTTAPNQKLEVNGNIRMPGDSDIEFGSSQEALGVVPGGHLTWRGGGVERVRFKSSGNVGIGTTTPAEKLEVAGTVKATAFEGDGSALTNLPIGGVPIGTLLIWPTDTPPDGYLLCDGSEASRTTYTAMFGVIGTIYGSGDGSTTFNLPDLRGRLPLGKDSMGGTSANRVTANEADTLGEGEGEENHTLTEAELPSHKHVCPGNSGSGGSHVGFWRAQNSIVDDDLDSSSTGGGSAHNNMPPYITLNYIIRAD